MFIIVFHCPMRVCATFGANWPIGGTLVAISVNGSKLEKSSNPLQNLSTFNPFCVKASYRSPSFLLLSDYTISTAPNGLWTSPCTLHSAVCLHKVTYVFFHPYLFHIYYLYLKSTFKTKQNKKLLLILHYTM